MGYGAADDIILRRPDSQNQRKKRKSGKIIFILFLLIIILGGATAGYWYYKNYILETPKAVFLKYVCNNNFEKVLNLDVYENMLNQMSNKSFLAETTADLTTNMKNDITEIADSSKFEFDLNISENRTEKKSLLDAKITYSSNDLFSLKILNTNNNVGIFSEEILDKYIASSKNELNNSLQKATGTRLKVSTDLIDNSLNSISNNKIDEEYKLQKIKEYSDVIYSLIPEESVSKKENVVVTIGTDTINTNAYTLNLDNAEYQEILQTILEKFKNDNDFLNKIVTGEKIENVESKFKINKTSLYEELIRVLFFRQKIKGTVQDLQEAIDEELSNISSINDGLKITVYVRNEEGKEQGSVKVVAEFSKNTSYDIEYFGDSKFKITYLSPETNDEEKEIIVGNSIEIEKLTTDVNIKYNIQYSKIENQKVVSKTQIELQTNNANTSKGYTNTAIVKYTNSEGYLKVNLKNEIKFQEENISEDFTDENTIFLDTLSEEGAKDLYEQIMENLIKVYAEKMVSLSFIENNSLNAVVQQPEQTQNDEEKMEIKRKLIEKVSAMMGEAEQNGEVFTIENLKDLSVDGYDVSSIVSSDLAIIKINGYTFNIDKDFMLSEQ